MKQIPDEEYEEVLKKLLLEKHRSLKADQWIIRKKRTIDYMIRKGFEPELINSFYPSK